ncbi:MAG: PorP/SprF family type IX secretion system membrane protein [Saprospiraceae bacterium]|nr:PorP/SprF family type IX secretion system membrane protein [Saprospiraceae bacterium]MBK7219891.1 PorP/SprF family type IX secretion system membrane protein [Saprospiraceae bacterium]MBK7787114.1 PorP/SprF family type IX secretion system membrane protein [Saprospiraceae bacterium]MBK8110615.1 PorP/SprF family type IX secretion system membrane protein [Saprospiraceae bacterium]MBK8849588.1 PorP/SprF family type IX secretion system membrane protein [Saprospiraceae bacterium]
MKYSYKLVFTLVAVVFTLGLSAQDIHFSQFYMSPLNLNPAMTGVMNCKNRFIANYRNQWAGALQANAYNTYSISYDQKTPIGREDYFGIGGTLWSDVAGESRFGTTQGRISLSYSKKMSGYRQKASYLVIGADAGISQRRIRENDLRWPSQIDANGFDPSKLGQDIPDNDFIYPDISAGVLWFSVMNKYTNWYLGAAIHHLNQPNVSFFGDSKESVSLYNRVTVHGGGQFEMKPKISFLPFAVFMMQGPHREFNGGASFRFALGPSRNSNQSWQIGAWYRLGIQDDDATTDDNGVKLHSDAVILSTRFNYEHFGIGFSYDLTVSGLAAASPANGAFEFSLTYDICGPESRGVYCPRF